MTISNEAVEAAGLKFRKKPVVIEAAKIPALFDIEGRTAFEAWANPLKKGRTLRWVGEGISVETLEGVMRAPPGDWLICGVQGELYPCAADIFAATYEPAAPHMLPAPEGVSEAEKRLGELVQIIDSGAIPGISTPVLRDDLRALLSALSSERERAERAEKERDEARAGMAYILDRAEYGDSYGVPGSSFTACHFCQGGGAPGAEMIHDPSCPVAKYPSAVSEWFAEMTDAESRAQAAEAKVKELEAPFDWTAEDLVDLMAEAIMDAIDMDTNATDYARATLIALNKEGLLRPNDYREPQQ